MKFASLRTLNLNYNTIANFPDFAGGVAPVLTNLSLRNNNFINSETIVERRLRADASGNTILNKIPTTVQYLDLAGNFTGSIDQGIFTRFTTLLSLNLGRGGGPRFTNDDQTAVAPNVSPTVETYNIENNDFRLLDTTNTSQSTNVKYLENLKWLNVSGNYYMTDNLSPPLGDGLSPNNNFIIEVRTNSTGLTLIDCNNKPTLERYYAQHMYQPGSWFNSSGTYKFDNCSSLTNLYMYRCRLTGAFPKFTNMKLQYLDLRQTRMSGGGPTRGTGSELASDADYVLPRDTFIGAPELTTFYSSHDYNGNTKPIHPDAFKFTPALTWFQWNSSYKTGGTLPDLTNCGNLYWLHLSGNRFGDDGTGIPTFSTNTKIRYIYLHDNQLTGTIPELKNLPSLDYLYLYNNKFTSIIQPGSLPNIRRIYLHINQIAGIIPDFTSCPRVQYLSLFRNKFNGYTVGSFLQLYHIRLVDVSNNNLPQSSINKIVDDLYDNWTAYNRRGVSINLRNNTAVGSSIKSLPSDPQLDKIYEMRAGGWSITID